MGGLGGFARIKSRRGQMPVKLLRETPSYRDLLKRWKKHKTGAPLRWGGLWGSSKACLTAALAADSKTPTLIIVPDAHAAEFALDDLAVFGAAHTLFPAREARLGAEADVLRDRHHALELVNRKGFAGILIAPLPALLQAVPAAGDEKQFLQLDQDMQLDPDELMRLLVAADFERVPAIANPGEFARRGEILDFFAPSIGEPLRLEFIDDDLESIRVFDLGSQRTRHVLKHVKIPLAHDLAEFASAEDTLPLERFPKNLRVLRWAPAAIDDAAIRLKMQGDLAVKALERLKKQLTKRAVLEIASLPGHDGSLTTLSVEEYCQGVPTGAGLLADRAADGERAWVVCSTDAESDRLTQILSDSQHVPELLNTAIGGLSKGFRIPEARITILHHREFVPGHGAHRPKPRSRKSRDTEAIPNVLSLRPGDLVVHVVHGLARYRGLDEGGRKGTQDVMMLEFDQGATLQVPVSRVDMVERYIGAGGSSDPKLDRLGSGSFEKRRIKVEAAVEDLAAEMLETQAKRSADPGFAFPEPNEDQREFEASFPWEDTPDQAQGTREIHDDLGLPRAMDRLLCGDVGYGKTELAARAAFRAISAGKQAAMLVPTTLLAEQHTNSLQQRFADWPIVIRKLSRLVSTTDKRETLEGLADGSVDFVIGTHRILSKDVEYDRLGLVIIDEEQRFGVRHKEQLKKKRAQVDVLTLTATPVPRTLHMALAGIRDITSLSTAPRGRQEIHTEIRYDDERPFLAKEIAREMDRGGQIFWLHNRVKDLELVAERIRRMVPGARVVTGHGQMDPRELEKAMLQFVRHDADILVATTIIESGIDIPNANTMIVSDAHRHGLANLHQLRGRIGRAENRGYCYLLIPRGHPLPQDARRRLKAIEELRYLGAGFQVAMRDLEIRGAGNLLGSEQSGHINAVGYETYRRLLSQAVARLKTEDEVSAAGISPVCDLSIGITASLSPEFIPDEEARLEILREMDRIRRPEQIDGILAAIRDRFGPPPKEVLTLARIFFLKHRLGALGLSAIQHIDDHLLCHLRGAREFERAMKGSRIDLRVLTPRRANWMLKSGINTPPRILEMLFRTASACRPAQNKRK